MVKARFLSEQQPVKVVNDGEKVYVFICLNGVKGVHKYNMDESNTSEEYIEYDYNEFVTHKGEIDIDDVYTNPDKYLNYPLPEVTEMEQLRADVDYLLMLEE